MEKGAILGKWSFGARRQTIILFFPGWNEACFQASIECLTYGPTGETGLAKAEATDY